MSGTFSHLTCGALTDVGVKRKNNEDSIKILPEYGVFCVADGMGGAQGGEVASQATVACLEQAFTQLSTPDAVASAAGKVRIIDRALNQASKWIKQRADKKGIKGTGTTAVVIAFDGRDPTKAAAVHAGDSRAYRYRSGELKQITRDHTVANAAGLEDESELPAMFKGVVTRAVGVNAVVELEQTPVDVAEGDIFLLCSDGLDKLMSDDDIAEYLKRDGEGDLQALAEAIVQEVNRRGGVDNVSVVLIRTSDPDPQSLVSEADDIEQIEEPITAGVPMDDSEQDTADNEPLTPTSESIMGITPPGMTDSIDALDTLDAMTPPDERRTDDSVGLPQIQAPAPSTSEEPWFTQNRYLVGIVAGCVAIISIAMLIKYGGGSDQVGPDFAEGIQEFHGEGERIGPRKRPDRTASEDPEKDPEALFEEIQASMGEGEEEETEPEEIVEPPDEEALAEAEAQRLAAEEEARREEAVRLAEEESAREREAEMARAEEEKQQQESAEKMRAANVAAYEDTLETLRGQIVEKIENDDSLESSSAAYIALDSFVTKEWPDVDAGQRDEAAAALQRKISDAFGAYIRSLRDSAIANAQESNADTTSWDSLRTLAADAPELVNLLLPVYESAVADVQASLDSQAGMEAFTSAVNRIRDAIPTELDSDLSGVEGAAVSLTSVGGKTWDSVSEGERDAALEPLRGQLESLVTEYTETLKNTALSKFEQGEDGEVEAARLNSIREEAPTLASWIGPEYSLAVDAVHAARKTRNAQAAFGELVARIDDTTPAEISNAEYLVMAEQAAVILQQLVKQSWDMVDEAEVEKVRDTRTAGLRDLSLAYLENLRNESVSSYEDRRDGGEALKTLSGMGETAPSLRALAGETYGEAVKAAEDARQTWRQVSSFLSTSERIHSVIPNSPLDPSELQQAEGAAVALAEMREKEWQGVPGEEVTAACEEMETQLTDLLVAYLSEHRDTAVKAYENMEDGANARDALKGLAGSAPMLLALAKEQYDEAVSVVDSAEQASTERAQQMAAEAARLEAERIEREEAEQMAEAAEKLANAKETIAARLDDALQTGAWGDLEEFVQSVDADGGDLVSGTGRTSQYDNWVAEWHRADSAGESLNDEIAGMTTSLAGLCEQGGLQPPSEPTQTDGDRFADAFCNRRRQLQEGFVQQLREFDSVNRAQIAMIGGDPKQSLGNIWSLARTTDSEAEITDLSKRIVDATEMLDRLTEWESQVPSGPIPAEYLASAPVDSLEKIALVLDDLWDMISVRSYEFLDQRSDFWLVYEDEEIEPLMDRISSALEGWEEDNQAYADASVRDWRMSGSHGSVDTLIRSVNEVYPKLKAEIEARNR